MTEMPSPLLNQAGFDAIRSLMAEKFTLLLQYYVEDSRLYLQTIEAGMATGDLSAVMTAAHTLKSTSRQFGLDRLADQARRVEEAALAGMEADASIEPGLLGELQQSFAETERLLVPYLSRA